MLVSGFRMQWHSLMELDDNGFLNRRSGFESRQEYQLLKMPKLIVIKRFKHFFFWINFSVGGQSMLILKNGPNIALLLKDEKCILKVMCNTTLT